MSHPIIGVEPYTFKPPGILATAGTPGHNEWGYPLHVCNGYRQDEHYWAWLKWRRVTKSPILGG